MGKPLLVRPVENRELLDHVWLSCQLTSEDKILLENQRPFFLQEIWAGALSLVPVGKPGDPRPPIALEVGSTRTGETSMVDGRAMHTVWAGVRMSPGTKLVEGQLFDVVLRTSDGQQHSVAPHAVFAKQDWTNFGAIHITDLHVSRRLEGFRRKLQQLGQTAAVKNFENWNDALRDFIRYANHLHDIGMLDVIIATGDLVSYIFENNDDRNGGGNFEFLKRILIGDVPYPDGDFYAPNKGKKAEELRVPVFMTLGNHDYRPNAYDLQAKLDAGDFGPIDLAPAGWGDKTLSNFSNMNLVESEALALQGGKRVRYEMQEAASKVAVVRNVPAFYKKTFGSEASYTVKLGANRLIMINSGMDEGILNAGAKDSIKYVLGFLSEDERTFVDGTPNQKGISQADVALIKSTLAQHAPGAVIVGIHGPPINPAGEEYPHYFRETEHPSINPDLNLGYLQRRDPLRVASHSDWLRSKTRNFKQKSPGDLLDFGVSRGQLEEFLMLCLGLHNNQAVDLVLCGHGHNRTEFRMDWNIARKFFRYYMDFYTENPSRYYKSIYNTKVVPIPNLLGQGVFVKETKKVHIKVVNSARVNGPISQVTDNRASAFWKTWQELAVPPYADPLNNTRDPKAWWTRHRTLILQTAALGPTTNTRRNREINPDPPGPVFQGFRYLSVANNAISRIRYVTMPELRAANFKLPWEVGVSAPVVGPVAGPPVAVARETRPVVRTVESVGKAALKL